MRTLFEAMLRHSALNPDAPAFSDHHTTLSRRQLFQRVCRLCNELASGPRVIGIYAPNGLEWAMAQLACAFAGKVAVPLPTFFSGTQLSHVGKDASVELVLTNQNLLGRMQKLGVDVLLIDGQNQQDNAANFVEGFGQIIYTSGSTGQPKGVRHESGQVGWSTAALASAIGASADDSYLSVLPLPLLLETICAIFIPTLVGASVYFDSHLAQAIGQGEVVGIAEAFEARKPTISVLVPQLLRMWVGELKTIDRRAPSTLRFVAAGGAPVSIPLAEAAWDVGIPVHEGYGLSECCSVVSVNRPGSRQAGTVGQPLAGLSVSIDSGEIVVDGPSVTDGYLGQSNATRPWRTGDLGAIDNNGFVTVHGRKDNLIVTSFGRNVSPEWIETMLLGDPRIAICAVVGHAQPFLTALIVYSSAGAGWFENASEAEVMALISTACDGCPDYAIPGAALVVSIKEAMSHQLLTPNGRLCRKEIDSFCMTKAPTHRSQSAPVWGSDQKGIQT